MQTAGAAPRRLPAPGGGGDRGGARRAAAPPPAPGRRSPPGRLGSAPARERGTRAPPAPTYRPPPDPHPPLRRTLRSNMAARRAPEIPPSSASGFLATPTTSSRPRPHPLSATPLPTLERGNRGPGRARQGAPPGRLRRAEAAPFPGNGLRVAGSGADSGTMSGRAGRRRLVLHVDLNNTVVAADAVSGLGPREALNIFLSTATWGREGADGERRARGPGAGTGLRGRGWSWGRDRGAGAGQEPGNPGRACAGSVGSQ